jgi:predicted nucleic acid-binding protein
MLVVDTDVFSALAKRRRHASVEAWIGQPRSSDLFVSVISIGEIERGIALQRKKDLNFAVVLARARSASDRLWRPCSAL